MDFYSVAASHEPLMLEAEKRIWGTPFFYY